MNHRLRFGLNVRVTNRSIVYTASLYKKQKLLRLQCLFSRFRFKKHKEKSSIKRKFPFKSLKFIACVNNFIVWDLVRSWKPDAM